MLGREEGKPLPPLPKPDGLVFGLPGNKAVTSHSWVKRSLTCDWPSSGRRLRPRPATRCATDAAWCRMISAHCHDALLKRVQGTSRGVAAIYQRNKFMEERKRRLTPRQRTSRLRGRARRHERDGAGRASDCKARAPSRSAVPTATSAENERTAVCQRKGQTVDRTGFRVLTERRH
jgi:hypothetical protein